MKSKTIFRFIFVLVFIFVLIHSIILAFHALVVAGALHESLFMCINSFDFNV
ncbi:hypothetical protein GCK32_021040 [Trichostrongylus colubriformis]|uniref:Uncharacterized protein n=1 Tax=Trichostrongylus colubriformis TaxID=6319 RepID=A0AAN8G8R8_TRICO